MGKTQIGFWTNSITSQIAGRSDEHFARLVCDSRLNSLRHGCLLFQPEHALKS
jgi:hypothetical protein